MYALNNGSAKVCGFNTATARCHTAKQFAEFLEPDRRRLFPNLQWLATRSVTPRAEHAAYVGLVLPKDNPFWSKHAPGSEWNCKCDVQETDADPSNQTHIPDLTPPRGLEGNPAITGEVFTDKVGYMRNCSNTQKRKIEHWAGNKILRKEAKQCMQKMQGEAIETKFENGQTIDVLIDSKTTDHISNDIADRADFLMNELPPKIKLVLKNSRLVAHEPNAKTAQKASAQHYYYYEYKIGNETFYINVEENLVAVENRHFYRLYSITRNLRETAIRY